MKEDLSGKVVVITGASSGFGKGAALAFAREGAAVALAARRSDLIDELAAECRGRGGEALALATDVSEAAQVDDLARAVVERYGQIDVWINNAGVGAIGAFERIPLADHVQVIRTDLLGTLYGSWFAYRRFLEQGHGILINLASELAVHSVPYYSSYTAAKHGILGLDDSLRQELRQNDIADIHVCTVMPTAHDTPFFDHVANYTDHEVQAPKPLHDPAEVIEALVKLAKNPRDRKIVGKDGIVKVAMKKLAPRIEEAIAGKVMHETQMEKAPPGKRSSGAVHAPTSKGTEVRVGRRRR